MKTALIVTSISSPNKALKVLSKGAAKNDVNFIVIGDKKSPADFNLPACNYYSLQQQDKLKFSFVKLCPTGHYSRKNIGYLLAMQKGASIIIETDDDNIPDSAFWAKRGERAEGHYFSDKGWLNVYTYFTQEKIWPRGFPLEYIQSAPPTLKATKKQRFLCPIQQGLANANPDVDALFRLIFPLPFNFRKGDNILLGENTICPFNSQNTTFFKRAFPLLYLPSYCSFRMTDIWRSFVAQRICWANSWNVLFHEATMRQERNEHNLLTDFSDEMSGYINNDKIYKQLAELHLEPGEENIPDNLLLCYKVLISMGLINPEELKLIKAWNLDIRRLAQTGR